jgi:hypothetical protein
MKALYYTCLIWGALAIVAIILAACDPLEYSDATDAAGNRYPYGCLNPDVHPMVIRLPFEEMQSRWEAVPGGMARLGRYEDGPKDGYVYVVDDLPADVERMVLQHERCHAAMHRLTGSFYWHD